MSQQTLIVDFKMNHGKKVAVLNKISLRCTNNTPWLTTFALKLGIREVTPGPNQTTVNTLIMSPAAK